MAKTIFTNARIIRGDGSPAFENGIFIFGNGADGDKKKILFAGPADEAPHFGKNDKVIDIHGKSILPGLFNVHVHLWMAGKYYGFVCDPYGIPFRTLIYQRHLLEALMCGVTTVRSVGGSDDIDIALRNAVNMGMVQGARLITCGQPIKPHGGHCHLTRGSVFASGPDQFREAVRVEMSKGVDQIKLMMTGGAGGTSAEGMYDKHMTDEETRSACEAAHMANKVVCAHLSNDMAINSAIDNGVDCVEHAYTLSMETANKMAQKGIFLVPTLNVTNSEDMQKEMQRLYGYPQLVIDRLKNARATHMASCKNAIDAGVTICTGTDNLPSDKVDGTWSTTREIELLAEAGMTPLEAIKAGTFNGAMLCGLNGITGCLSAGLEADFIIVQGEPDKQIKDIRNMMMVCRGGDIAWSSVEGCQYNAPFSREADLLGQWRAW